MQAAPQVLRPRQTHARRVRIDAGEVGGWHVTDENVGHASMISADSELPRGRYGFGPTGAGGGSSARRASAAKTSNDDRAVPSAATSAESQLPARVAFQW